MTNQERKMKIFSNNLLASIYSRVETWN